MRNSSRTLACAPLATSIALAGFAGPAVSAETPDSPPVASTPEPDPPVATPKPAPKPAPALTRTQKVIAWAGKQQGKPYRYSAEGPSSFDCAGYVQYVFGKSGKKIGRTSGAQLKGKHIAKSKKKPGDILIFRKNGRAYHSAIYAGGGKMWEAQRSGTRVGKHKIWSKGYVVRRP